MKIYQILSKSQFWFSFSSLSLSPNLYLFQHTLFLTKGKEIIVIFMCVCVTHEYIYIIFILIYIFPNTSYYYSGLRIIVKYLFIKYISEYFEMQDFTLGFLCGKSVIKQEGSTC